MEHQADSFVSPQLELNVLTEAVSLICWSQTDPAVRVDQVRVSAVDVRVLNPSLEAPGAGVELRQGALVDVGAVGEGVPSEARLAGAVVRTFGRVEALQVRDSQKDNMRQLA